MSIRLKIIMIMVPILLFALMLTSTISSLYTKAGLEKLAIQSYSFKSHQFEQFINEQWNLLQENDLSDQESFVQVFYDSLRTHAFALLENKAEMLFGFDKDTSEIIFNTSKMDIQDSELKDLLEQININSLEGAETDKSTLSRDWIDNSFMIGEHAFVGYYFIFPPKNFVVVVAITRAEFYQPIFDILIATAILMLITILISVIIIMQFSKTLINPLQSMVNSMKRIIDTNSFKERVEIKFNDEVGDLSQTFNVMVTELEQAYQQIKQYAFSAIVAQKNESKIRNIFQKYVPKNVVDNLVKDPTRLLLGENRHLSLLFTDIRDFTTISETYAPEELVLALNNYFGRIVDIIMDNDGIIDKYIGDAIMAFFGAPLELDNSPMNAVKAALKIEKSIDEFNKKMLEKKKPQFKTGIGINYGLVTVGNIGSDKKMDYTAIGDAVNLGARLEELTKMYAQTLIFSTSVRDAVQHEIPCRTVDIVQVKGKTTSETIYTSTSYMTETLAQIYEASNGAIALYKNQDFDKALRIFQQVKKFDPKDFIADMYIERCQLFLKNPPAKDWNGVFIMTKK